jgi:recombination protein RecR
MSVRWPHASPAVDNLVAQLTRLPGVSTRTAQRLLGGALSPLDGVESSDLRVEGLLQRVDGGSIEDVVLATNPNMTGEATAAYLAHALRDRRVTRRASGLPVGDDIEYADEVTLRRALAGRRPA